MKIIKSERILNQEKRNKVVEKLKEALKGYRVDYDGSTVTIRKNLFSTHHLKLWHWELTRPEWNIRVEDEKYKKLATHIAQKIEATKIAKITIEQDY
jgi:hypothetical protein